MDIRRLEIFCKIVETKSFSRAAEAVLLSQPTVSEHVRILEETFDQKLLDRLGREVLPTPTGALLYDYARRIIQLRDEAMQAIRRLRGDLSGNLVLGASTIPGAYLLPSYIETFHTLFPAGRITLRISGTGRIVQDVAEGLLEMGIVGALPKEGTLEAREMFGDELLLAVWPGHPWAQHRRIAPSELCGAPFIMRESGSGTRRVMERGLRAAGVDPTGLSLVAEMGSNEAVRECVKGRLGISFLSSLSLKEDLERGDLISVGVEGVRLRRSFYLVRRRSRELTPLAQAFLEHLHKPAAPRPDTMREKGR